MNALPKLIFELSREGKIGCGLNASRRPGRARPRRRPAAAPPSPIFPQVSEVEIVRHYMALARLNYSVDDGFYPLGSCTMKYNPKINEKLAAADEFQAHPYAPHDLVQGNLEIMARLEEWLVALTGMAGFTLTPAAGAHGEFTGMLIIRKYLQEKGDARKVVLIPDSAHGTNPASAHFAGYEVREIPSNAQGIIGLEELRAHLNPDVAALMMTNPNTLGIFESNISAIADGPARQRLPALHGRRQPQRPAGGRPPRRPRRRRHAHQPAQDLRHAPRRRRPGLGAGRRGRPLAAFPARAARREERGKYSRWSTTTRAASAG